MQLYFFPNIKQQSHKQASRMLIEHTNRSTEDKPKIHLTWSTKYMCCGALRRSTRCFNQQSLNTINQAEVSHNPLRQLYKSTQSQRYPSQRATQNSSNKNSTQQGQRSTPSLVFLCQKMQTAEIEVLGEFEVKLTKHWPKSTLVKSALKP